MNKNNANIYVVDCTVTFGDSFVIKALDESDAKNQVIEMIKNGQIDISNMIKLNQNVTVQNKSNEKKFTFS